MVKKRESIVHKRKKIEQILKEKCLEQNLLNKFRRKQKYNIVLDWLRDCFLERKCKTSNDIIAGNGRERFMI